MYCIASVIASSSMGTLLLDWVIKLTWLFPPSIDSTCIIEKTRLTSAAG